MNTHRVSFYGLQSEKNASLAEHFFYFLAIAYFAYQAITFACEVPFGMPPDERLHTYAVSLFAKLPGFFPAAASLPPLLADKGFAFPLYYKTMGILLLFLKQIAPEHILLNLRIVNVLFGLINVYVCMRFLKLVFKNDPAARILSYTLYVTLLMFPFVSGAINWDNLSNLLCMLGIYICFLFIDRKDFVTAGRFFLVCGLGIISKNTTLPVFLSLSCIVLFYLYKNRIDLLGQFQKSFLTWRGRFSVLYVVISLLVFLASVFHFATIIVQYKTVMPSCTQFYSKEECTKGNIIFKKYEALTLKQENDPAPLLDPLSHFVIWSDLMVSKVLGVFAYKSWYPPRDIIVVVELLILFSLVQLIRTFSLSNRTQLLLLIISLFYISVLFGYVNYKGYLEYGIIPRYTFVGIQGRYIFPVLAPIIVLFSKNLLRPFAGRLRTILALGLCLFFFGIGFPLIMHQDPAYRYVDNRILQNDFIEAVKKSQTYLFD